MLRRIVPTAERTVTRGGNKTIDKGNAIRERPPSGRHGRDFLRPLHDCSAPESLFGNVPLAVAAVKQGAFDFFEKPFDADDLLASIRAALMCGSGSKDEFIQVIGAALQ